MLNVVEKPEFKRAWSVVGRGLSIKTDHDYRQAVAMLDWLLDEVGENERHPLFDFLEVLGTVIESYETDHVEMKGATPIEVLTFLMEERKLTQADLPEIGSQGVVSEVLHGKRELNARQISLLSKRFNISPAAFF